MKAASAIIQAAQAATPRHVVMIADDLTGACDAAAAFAARGFVTEVGITPEATPTAACEVWSRSTESRDITVDDAERKVREAFAHVPAGATIFKKIDSMFRGNTFAEIALAIDVLPHAAAWIAPAFPAAGRTCVGGTLRAHDASGNHTLPLQEPLLAHGVQAKLLGRDSRTALASTTRKKGQRDTFLCDAVMQSDMEELVTVAQQRSNSNLWIGSAGLAHAFASYWSKHDQNTQPTLMPAMNQGGDVLAFIGTTHEMTSRQLRALRSQNESYPHVKVVNLSDTPHATEAILSALDSYKSMLPAAIFVTGGATASLVFHALGVESLRIHGEFVPGLPYGTVAGGLCDGTAVLLKSGGFGHETVLCDIGEWFRTEMRHS